MPVPPPLPTPISFDWLKQEWTPMQVNLVGQVRDVVQVDNKISPPIYVPATLPEIPNT